MCYLFEDMLITTVYQIQYSYRQIQQIYDAGFSQQLPAVTPSLSSIPSSLHPSPFPKDSSLQTGFMCHRFPCPSPPLPSLLLLFCPSPPALFALLPPLFLRLSDYSQRTLDTVYSLQLFSSINEPRRAPFPPHLPAKIKPDCQAK